MGRCAFTCTHMKRREARSLHFTLSQPWTASAIDFSTGRQSSPGSSEVRSSGLFRYRSHCALSRRWTTSKTPHRRYSSRSFSSWPSPSCRCSCCSEGRSIESDTKRRYRPATKPHLISSGNVNGVPCRPVLRPLTAFVSTGRMGIPSVRPNHRAARPRVRPLHPPTSAAPSTAFSTRGR